MLATALPRRVGRGAMQMLSHAGDGTVTQVCTSYGKVVQPLILEHRGVVASLRSQIFVLACNRVIAGKYHNLETSPYGKNLTLLSVSNKGFAHRLAGS
jgi:hypothetical protein